MQLFDFFGSDGFDDESPIVGHPELRVGSARRVGGNRFRLAYGIQILSILDSEALAQVAENQRRILLDFEMTRHVLSATHGRKRAENVDGGGERG